LRTQPAAGLALSAVVDLDLYRWDVAAVVAEAVMVEPVDLLAGGALDLIDIAPGLAGFDQFGLIEPVDGR
jgi:hypothetical protein